MPILLANLQPGDEVTKGELRLRSCVACFAHDGRGCNDDQVGGRTLGCADGTVMRFDPTGSINRLVLD